MEKIGKLYRESVKQLLKEELEKRNNGFILSYASVSASQMNELRKGLNQLGAKMFVVKNAFAKIALKELNRDKICQFIEGPTAFVCSNSDEVSIAKLLVKFSNDYQGLELRGAFLKEEILNQNDCKVLASLPSREILYTKLLGVIEGPLNKLVFVLSQKLRELLSVLKQIENKNKGRE